MASVSHSPVSRGLALRMGDLRGCHDDARAYLERRMSTGNTKTEALRALKRRLSDVVYRALTADAQPLAATYDASPACDAEAA